VPASPLVSSAFALLKKVRGNLTADRLRRLLTTTSKPIPWHDGRTVDSGILAPAPQQGAGIVQAWNAVHTTAELSIASIAWNDTDHFNNTRTFSILNTGSEDTVFELTHKKAVTMYGLHESYGVLRVPNFPSPIAEDWADIQFSSTRITVPVRQSSPITLTLTPQTSLNTTLLPVYSGYIYITPTTSNITHTLPYVGVSGSMRSTPVLEPSLVYFADFYAHAPANRNYTIARPDPAHPPPTDDGDQSKAPNVHMELMVGSAVARVDVLQNGEVAGPAAGSLLMYLLRGESRIFFTALLADGTVLDEGKYALRISALRIFGDEENREDWDVADTVDFNIKYMT
jgi:hypothetical protein